MGFTIERISCKPETEVQKRLLANSVPVVLTDYVERWPAWQRWTPEYLREQIGDTQVPVVSMRDGDYAHAARTSETFRDYLDYVLQRETDIKRGKAEDAFEVTRYLAQVPIKQTFPELLNDIEVPPFFENETFSSSVVYVGGTLFSQLHYHPRGSAMLCMLYGEKTVRLFPPNQTGNLYPNSLASGLAHVSQTRHSEPDPGQFPKFQQARSVEVTLCAGECLFIPIYWWHSIQNRGVSISAVFFWSRSWASRFVPPPGPRAPYLYQPVADGLSIGKRAINKLRRVTGLKTPD